MTRTWFLLEDRKIKKVGDIIHVKMLMSDEIPNLQQDLFAHWSAAAHGPDVVDEASFGCNPTQNRREGSTITPPPPPSGRGSSVICGSSLI